ncbi:MAG: SDR family NAD(P)-dependent oxidoreductase [Verrucomicrobiota bacterium]
MPSPAIALNSYTAVVVTGGSSGIGRAFIERVVKLNPKVCFGNLSRREPEIKMGELKLRHFPCDLAEQGELPRHIAEVLRWLKQEVPPGKVLLVNNSGFGGYGRIDEIAIDHQLGMIDVNVRAVVALTAGLLPILRERGGCVMTIASTAAFQPTPYLATYGATKAFVLHWSLALNEDLRGSGVTALAVCPGPTSTEFFKRAGLKQGSVPDSVGQTTDQVVNEALAAFAAGRTQIVTGWKNKLMVLGASLLPKPIIARLAASILARYRLNMTDKADA